MRFRSRWIILVLFSSINAAAQQPGDQKLSTASFERMASTAAVTGHVYLDDTKVPARKAMVSLVPISTLEADAPPQRGAGRDPGPVTVTVETHFDGGYAFTHVAPGAYYIIATRPGYISPYVALSPAEARSEYGEWAPLRPQQKSAKNRIIQSLPRVDVASNFPANADVVLERGGAINGTVSYDDSGPAAGLQVGVLVRMFQNGKEIWSPLNLGPPNGFMGQIVTDDRGNYRISGLPPGKYVVEVTAYVTDLKTYTSSSGSATSSSNAHTATLSMYSGNTPRKKDVADFRLEAREERTGEDIIVPMSKLHTVRGNIVSAHDGHVVNGGQVYLLNADDHAPVAAANMTEDDPSFTFSLIFDGDYVLSCPFSADVDYVALPRAGSNPGPQQYQSLSRHFYGSTSMPLHVNRDVDGVTLAVPEPTAKEAEMYKKVIQEQERQAQPATPQ